MSRQLALPDMASENEGLSLGSYLSAKEDWSVVQLRSSLGSTRLFEIRR